YIVRLPGDELRRERSKIFGKFSFGQTVSFEPAGEGPVVRGRLRVSGADRDFMDRRKQHRCNVSMMNDSAQIFPQPTEVDFALEFAFMRRDFVEENSLCLSVKHPFGIREPAEIHLLLIVPAMWSNALD